MKQWILVGAGAVLVFLFFFNFGTKPVVEEEKSMNETNVLSGKQWAKAPDLSIDTTKSYSATIKTSKGDMKLTLFAKETPQTVNNFVFLAREKFYDGVIFHRIIKDFMIQGGDPTGTGTGGPGYKFEDEAVTRDYKRGILAMANSGTDTNGSQFFIMTQDSSELPKSYTIFGSIEATDTESLKTLDAIASTPVEAGESGEISTPTEQVTITTVEIEEK